MILSLALLATLWPATPWPPPAQEAYEEVQRALDDGAYGVAWELAAEIESSAVQARARATILSRAGDLLGSLRAAEEGLVDAPQQLDLLFHATANSLALRDAKRARLHLESLAVAVEASGLAPEHRPAWQAVASDFRARVEELERLESERGGALSAARTSSLLLLGLITLAFLRLAAGAKGAMRDRGDGGSPAAGQG